MWWERVTRERQAELSEALAALKDWGRKAVLLVWQNKREEKGREKDHHARKAGKSNAKPSPAEHNKAEERHQRERQDVLLHPSRSQ